MGTATVVLLLIVVAAGAATEARGHPADGTPAARFWAQALPGTPMPLVIADLVQRGTDRSPLAEHHSAAFYSASGFLDHYSYSTERNLPPRAAGYLASGFLDHYSYSTERNLPPRAATYLASGFLDNYLYSTERNLPAVEGLFFRESEMRVGGAMTVSLPAASPAAFLPRAAADRIPFGNLKYALNAFGIAPGSDEAAQVSDTLRGCSAPALAGEEKACATSLEGVVLIATRMLGTTRHSQIVAAASALPSAGLPHGQYAVQAVNPLGGGSSRFVACHPRPYPYAVYSCHLTMRSSKAYVVSIRRGADPEIAMAALCHFDTSNWSPDHPAFEALHTKPGGSPVCHFMPYADVLFGADA